MQNSELIDLYLKNLDKCRSLGNDIDYLALSDLELINLIKNNANKRFEIMCENKSILKSILYDVDIKDLTKEDANLLDEFGKKLFDYSLSKDSGLYLDISKKLLDYANYIKSDSLIIKYSYNTAMGLFYTNGLSNSICEDYKIKISEIFNSVIDKYFKYYDKYDTNTKYYLLRAFGNRKLGRYRNTYSGAKKALDISNELIDILNDPYVRKSDPTIPFDKMIYATHSDLLANCMILRTENPADYDDFLNNMAKSLLKSIEYLEKEEDKNKTDESRVQNFRIEYYSHVIRYHNKIISIYELIDYFYNKIKSADSNDFTYKGIRDNITFTSYMLEYTSNLKEEERNKLSDKIDFCINKALKYIDNLKDTNYPQLVNTAFNIFAQTDAKNNKSNIELLNHMIHSHRPTYVHSLMVAVLTKNIASSLIDKKPELFVGIYNNKTIEDVVRNKSYILDKAFNAALYHDLGKSVVISYIATYERGLTDAEFECIKNHTEYGAKILNMVGEAELADAALFHHKFYDDTKGYPNIKNDSKIKIIIDIISVADSLDAATDFIGRSYKIAKNLDDMLKEFESFKGTRYNPYVVDILCNKLLSDRLKYILDIERKRIYISVYKDKLYEREN